MHATNTAAAALCLLIASAAAVPLVVPSEDKTSTAPQPIRLPLTRRRPVKTADAFFRKAEQMKSRYGDLSTASSSPSSAARLRRKNRRRSGTSASTALTNYEDVEFYTSIAVGTPASNYSVVIDTGSADLILAAEGCSGCSTSTPVYEASSSSSSVSTGETFSITYGSGDASGTLVEDTVSISQFTIKNQTFAACDVMNDILDGSISGLLGLGWKGIAQSGATPLLENLAQSGQLESEIFALALDEYDDTTSQSETAAGGTMTIGALDTSLYSGDINWIDIVEPAGYWAIPLQGVSVGGQSLGLTAESAAIDSGTTLIGGPSDAVATFYAQLSGSQALTESGYSGYYTYECGSTVNATFTFGGVAYSVSDTNFNAGAIDSSGTQCLGALFSLDSSASVTWIFGDAFLTGLYSAYRFSSPAAVGFATLGSGGTDSSSSSTLTSNAASSSASSSASSTAKSTSLAGRRVSLGGATVVAGLFTVVVGALL